MEFNLDLLKKYADETFICYEKHPTADRYIFGYYSGDFKPIVWNEMTKHCRGMILDGMGKVVEHPFMKFWTFKQYLSKDTILLNDNQIMKLPHGKFKIMEKIDGTMCTLYWINNQPYLATQRSFTNPKAVEATKILYDKYKHVFQRFDRNYTYIFEAVYPESNVLIDYGSTRDLFLIGKVNKKTGKPCDIEDIGFPMAKDYTKEYGHVIDFNELISLNLPNHEGFVIYLANGNMIKLKFPWYQEAHRILDSILNYDRKLYLKVKELRQILKVPVMSISRNDVCKALQNKDFKLNSILQNVPSYFYMMGFENWLQDVKNRIVEDSEKGTNIDYNAEFSKAIEVFDIDERMSTPNIYETSVINWKKRYLK